MADQKKQSAMLPIIIVGACLFGFGIYQSTKPQEREVNTGFVAPPTPPAIPSPSNPRTMQAPDAPPLEKDAAQRAAEAEDTTASKDSANGEINGAKVQLSASNIPWLQGIIAGTEGKFSEAVLNSLKAEQAKGGINCAPVLTTLSAAELSNIEKVDCTAKDGAQIQVEFDQSGDGDLTIEYPDGGKIAISKNDGDFNVETRNSQE